MSEELWQRYLAGVDPRAGMRERTWPGRCCDEKLLEPRHAGIESALIVAPPRIINSSLTDRSSVREACYELARGGSRRGGFLSA